MSQRNWQRSKLYCSRCGTWILKPYHTKCPRGQRNSLLFVDIANFEMGCNKCNSTWSLEDTEIHCGKCGSVTKTQYSESTITVRKGDQIIATDGDLVYILTRTGEVVVGYRRYLNIAY